MVYNVQQFGILILWRFFSRLFFYMERAPAEAPGAPGALHPLQVFAGVPGAPGALPCLRWAPKGSFFSGCNFPISANVLQFFSNFPRKKHNFLKN